MLKIKFWRIKNVLLMQVLEQGDEIERGFFAFSTSNGVEFNSSRLPEIELKKIFIRGENKKEDNKVAVFDCEDERKAKILLNRYIEAVRECNNSLRKENRNTEVAE